MTQEDLLLNLISRNKQFYMYCLNDKSVIYVVPDNLGHYLDLSKSRTLSTVKKNLTAYRLPTKEELENHLKELEKEK